MSDADELKGLLGRHLKVTIHAFSHLIYWLRGRLAWISLPRKEGISLINTPIVYCFYTVKEDYKDITSLLKRR